MTADELHDIERVWTSEAVSPFSSAIEVCQHSGPRDIRYDGVTMYAQVLALIAEVKRLRATAVEALDEAVGRFDPREGYEMLDHVRDRLGM